MKIKHEKCMEGVKKINSIVQIDVLSCPTYVFSCF